MDVYDIYRYYRRDELDNADGWRSARCMISISVDATGVERTKDTRMCDNEICVVCLLLLILSAVDS